VFFMQCHYDLSRGLQMSDDCDQSACAMGRDAMQLVDHAYY